MEAEEAQPKLDPCFPEPTDYDCERPLCVGDVLLLRPALTHSGHFLFGEGDLDSRAGLATLGARGGDVTGGLFRLCPQLNYAVLKSMSKTRPTGAADLQALEHRREREVEHNAQQLLLKRGTPLLYGQVVQLQHVASGKFLCVQMRPADVQPGALKAVLQEGSDMAHLRLEPRFQFCTTGSPVMPGAQVALRPERTVLNTLCAADEAHPLELHTGRRVAEANFAPSDTGWILHPYLSHEAALLQAGVPLRLFHGEVPGFLVGSRFQPSASASDEGIQGMWRMERENSVLGGEVGYGSIVCLRQLVSNKLLARTADGDGVELVADAKVEDRTAVLMTVLSAQKGSTSEIELQDGVFLLAFLVHDALHSVRVAVDDDSHRCVVAPGLAFSQSLRVMAVEEREQTELRFARSVAEVLTQHPRPVAVHAAAARAGVSFVLSAAPHQVPWRQALLRELGVIDAVMTALARGRPSDEEPTLQLHRLLYQLLTVSFHTAAGGGNCLASQLYISSPERTWLRFLVSQLPRQLGAGEALTHLVDSIAPDASLLSTFASNIATRGPDVVSLNFLIAAASRENLAELRQLFLPPETRGQLVMETALNEQGKLVVSWASAEAWGPFQEALFHSPEALGLPVDHRQRVGEPRFMGSSPALAELVDNAHNAVLARAPSALLAGEFATAEVFGVREADKDADALPFSTITDGLHALDVVADPAALDELKFTLSVPGWLGWVAAVPFFSLLGRARRSGSDWVRVDDLSRCPRLLAYYEAQIELFAALCKERSRVIEEMFPFDVVMTGMSEPSHSPKLRTAFARLMLALFVDRFPFDPTPAPHLVIALDDAPGAIPGFELDAGEAERLGMPTDGISMSDMRRLRDWIQLHLAQFDCPTKLTAAMADIMLAMLLNGHLADVLVNPEQLSELLANVERQLLVEDLEEQQSLVAPPSAMGIELSSLGNGADDDEDEDDGAETVGDDEHHYQANFIRFLTHLQQLGTGAHLRALYHEQRCLSDPDAYLDIEFTHPASKLDFALASRLYATATPFVTEYCLRLSASAGGHSVRPLVDAALDMVFLVFSRDRAVLHSCADVIVVPERSAVNRMRTQLAVLAHGGDRTQQILSELSEYLQPAGSEQARVLQPIAELLGAGAAEAPIDLERQHLLRAIGMHTTLLALPSSAGGLVYEVLGKFACRNSVNQRLLFGHLDRFIPLAGSDVGVLHLLRRIFEGNRVLCDEAPRELFEAVTNNGERLHPAALRLLSALCVVDGDPIARNQIIALQLLMPAASRMRVPGFFREHVRALAERFQEDRKRLITVHEVPVDPARVSLALVTAIAADPSTFSGRLLVEQTDEWRAGYQELAHCIGMLRLIAFMCEGRIGSAEAQGQSLLPLARIMRIIDEPWVAECAPLTAALWSFTTMVHVDTQVRAPASEVVGQLADRYDQLARGMARTIVAALHLRKYEASAVHGIERLGDAVDVALRLASDAVQCFDRLYVYAKGSPSELSTRLEGLANAFGITRYVPSLGGRETIAPAAGPAVAAAAESTLADSQVFALGAIEASARPATQALLLHYEQVVFNEKRKASVLQLMGRWLAHVARTRRTDVLTLLTAHLERLQAAATTLAHRKMASETKRRAAALRWRTAQEDLLHVGAVSVVIELVSAGEDEAVTLAALRFGVALLAGGRKVMQEAFAQHSRRHPDSAFWPVLKRLLKRASEHATVERRRKKKERVDLHQPLPLHMRKSAETHLLVLQLVQQLTEGHFSELQELLGEARLLRPMMKLLCTLAKSRDRLERFAGPREVTLLMALFNALVECMQGPCQANQLHAISSSFLIDCISSVLDATFSSEVFPCSPHLALCDVKRLKGAACKTLTAILEGRADTVAHAAIAGRLDVTVVRKRLRLVYCSFVAIQRTSSAHKEAIGADMASFDEAWLEEGVDLLKVVHQLGPESEVFAEAVKPRLRAPLVDRRFRSFELHLQAIIDGRESPSAKALALDPHPLMIKAALLHRRRGRHSAQLQQPNAWTVTAYNVLNNELDPTGRLDLPYNVRDDSLVPEASRALLEEMQYVQAFAFLEKQTSHIEISWHGRLQRVYFQRPSALDYLTETAKSRILQDVDCEAPDVMAKDFIQRCVAIYEELVLEERLSKIPIYRFVSHHLHKLNMISFWLAVTMNMIFLLDLERPGTRTHTELPSAPLLQLAQELGYAQICCASTVLVFLLVRRVPLLLTKIQQRTVYPEPHARVDFGRQVTEFVTAYRVPVVAYGMLYLFSHIWFLDSGSWEMWTYSKYVLVLLCVRATREFLEGTPGFFGRLFCLTYDVCGDAVMAFHTVYLVIAFYGLWAKPAVYSFHLLDMVLLSSTLRNVVRAVTEPIKSLVLTGCLTVVVIYIFAIIGQEYLVTEFQPESSEHIYDVDNVCYTLWSCTLTTIWRGLLAGGGIGDVLLGDFEQVPNINWSSTNNYFGRMLFDLSFFVLVTIALLNIVFGIIIDRFSALRDEQTHRTDTFGNACFICSLPRSRFDALPEDPEHPNMSPFELHEAEHHHKWNYLSFTVYLRAKEETEYDGVESYVAAMMEAEDTAWLPRGQALSLAASVARAEADEEAERRAEEGEQLERLSAAVVSQTMDRLRPMLEPLQAMDRRMQALEAAVLGEQATNRVSSMFAR